MITDSTRAHSGNNYLQLSTTTAQVWTGNQVIAVNPGDQLTFGGWVYLEPGSATGGMIGWNIEVMDANGNALGIPGASNITAGAWTYQSVNYTVPTGAASVWLYAQIYQPTGTTTVRFDDGFLTGASGQGVHYYHGDHLGSARLMTDSGGNVTWSATYLPFGQEWNPQATTNHYKFTAKERDSESNLDNFGARYYSSSFGRFLSPDPLGIPAAKPAFPQTWNLYTYVVNNPVNLTDPTGLWCVWDDGTGHDDDPKDGGATKTQCHDQGGHWDQTDTVMNMWSDNNGNITAISWVGGTIGLSGSGFTTQNIDAQQPFFDPSQPSTSAVPHACSLLGQIWEATDFRFKVGLSLETGALSGDLSRNTNLSTSQVTYESSLNVYKVVGVSASRSVDPGILNPDTVKPQTDFSGHIGPFGSDKTASKSLTVGGAFVVGGDAVFDLNQFKEISAACKTQP